MQAPMVGPIAASRRRADPMPCLAIALVALLASGCQGDIRGRDGAAVDAEGGVADGAVADARAGDSAVGDGAAGDSAAGDGGSGACTPQAIEPCACSDAGVAGTSECLPDGHAFAACDCRAYGRAIYVAPGGSDTASGDVGAPKATLDGALTVVRGLVAGGGLPAGGVVVWMAPGVYTVGATEVLGADASGTVDRPVVIRAQAGAPVRLVGGRTLPGAGFAPVSASDPDAARIGTTVRDSLRVFDLTAAGVTDFGQLRERGFCASGVHSGLELFVDGAPMRLGRWPDADQNDAVAPTPDDAAIDLYGNPVPDVTGHYVKTGESDGVGVFVRAGLVGTLQYRLYRYTWTSGGMTHQAWFLTTASSGYPGGSDPWWSLYASDFSSPMSPGPNGSTGQVVFQNPNAVNHGFVNTTGPVSTTSFGFLQDRPSRWAAAPDAWVHGFWTYGWADCHLPVSAIDASAHTVTVGAAPSFGISTGTPWYAYNLLEEVDQPGEWYLDRARGRLYLDPPYDLAHAEVLVSQLDGPLLRLDNASYVELRGLVLEGGRGNLLEVDGGAHNHAVGVTLRNAGADGADVTGTDNGLVDALVHDVGATGVALGGGDRPTLAAATNFVDNSHLHDYARWEWTYRPAVAMTGVGQRASHNLIHDAPHNAVLYSGNEHLIDANDIHHVNRFSSDAGAIYGGRDWGGRGVVIRNNHLHDLATYFPGTPIAAVYLDDCLSGIQVTGNLIVDVAGHAILHGGGRDDIMNGNVIVRATTAVAADARCATWGRPSTTPGDSNNLLEKLLMVGYRSAIWSARYPACAAIPDNYPAIFDPAATWLYPEGSSFSSNVGFDDAAWMSNQDDALGHYVQANNLESTVSPFVDEAHGDLTLTPAVLAVTGFTPIPVDQIGIQ